MLSSEQFSRDKPMWDLYAEDFVLHLDVGPGVSGDYYGKRAVQDLVVDTLGDFEFNKVRSREDVTIGPFVLWFLHDITVRDGQRHECSEVIVFRVGADGKFEEEWEIVEPSWGEWASRWLGAAS